MNKSFILYWTLIAALVISVIIAVVEGIALHQANQLNHFISHVDEYDTTPEQPRALLARAYNDVQYEDRESYALEGLTHLIALHDIEMTPEALVNRGNINLRRALTLRQDDKKRIPLVELAKQDYRKALLLNSELWDVRFNLELALTMVPELPSDSGLFEKPQALLQNTVEAVGFKVDLP